MKSVLVIGTGGIGKRHVRAFLKTGRARLCVVEPDEQKRAGVCRDYDVEEDYADISEVDLSAFDAGVICAPAHVHVPLAQALADAGVHFLMEKPLAVTMDGVARLIETVNARKLVGRVGYVRRASEETIRFREEIVQGRIGEPLMCYINISQDFAKYRPDYQRIYYAKKATGGGAILDGVSHMIDLLLWIMGDISEVVAMYDRLALKNVECEDSALVSLRFSCGAMAQINMNQFQKPNIYTVEMIGTKGNLVMDAVESQVRFAGDDSGKWEVEDFARGLSAGELHEGRFRRQADMFMDIIEGKPGHLTTLEEARYNLRIVLAARESYEAKRIVPIS